MKYTLSLLAVIGILLTGCTKSPAVDIQQDSALYDLQQKVTALEAKITEMESSLWDTSDQVYGLDTRVSDLERE